MQLAEMEAKLQPQTVVTAEKPFGDEVEPSAPDEDLPEPPPYEDVNLSADNSDTEVDAF